jgi:hypothetical protein
VLEKLLERCRRRRLGTGHGHQDVQARGGELAHLLSPSWQTPSRARTQAARRIVSSLFAA